VNELGNGEDPTDAVELTATVKNKVIEKCDRFLSNELVCFNYAASHLDTQNTWATLKKIK
jgi:ATP-dependent helicase Lhr and Lhr-like helicase